MADPRIIFLSLTATTTAAASTGGVAAHANLSDQKASMKRLIKRKVGLLSRLSDKEHSHIHAELNRMHGETTPTATADGLEARLATLDRWLAQAGGLWTRRQTTSSYRRLARPSGTAAAPYPTFPGC